jgi:hypothetical protein
MHPDLHGKDVEALSSAPATPPFSHENTLRRYYPKKGILEGGMLLL